jgi:hypothetical protein
VPDGTSSGFIARAAFRAERVDFRVALGRTRVVHFGAIAPEMKAVMAVTKMTIGTARRAADIDPKLGFAGVNTPSVSIARRPPARLFAWEWLSCY